MKDKQIDLGTIIDVDMYYRNNKMNGNSNSNSKTLRQQVVDNDSAPSALSFAPKAFQAVSDKDIERDNVCGLLGGNGSTTQKQQVVSNTPGFIRLNPNAKYDRICIQMTNLRIGKRFNRANIYVSMKESTENKFNVFLTGALTNSKHELYRGCKNSQAVKSVIDALFGTYPDMMIGRLRYKPINGFITDFHRKNTKSAIIGVYKNHLDEYIAVLVLYYEFIEIPLTHPLSEKQQGWCVYQGILDDYEEFDDEEE